jgi:phospholipase/carboxylesterase
MLDELDPDRRLFGMTPGAPLTNVPPGGRHWYVVEVVGQPDEQTYLSTMEKLCSFLDGELARRGIPWEKTVIGGFSQGAVMACGVAIGEGRPRAAGLLMMSGFYPEVPGWTMDPGAKAGMPAYVTHGAYDPVIPVTFGREANEKLEAGGLRVTYRETRMQHGVEFSLLPEIRDWVAAAVAGEES